MRFAQSIVRNKFVFVVFVIFIAAGFELPPIQDRFPLVGVVDFIAVFTMILTNECRCFQICRVSLSLPIGETFSIFDRNCARWVLIASRLAS